MPRDPRAYLWDARRAAALVGEFIEGRCWDDYSSDALLRSAVERQFEIIGEQHGLHAESLGGEPPCGERGAGYAES